MPENIFVLVIEDEGAKPQVTLWGSKEKAKSYLFDYVSEDYPNKINMIKYREEIRHLISRNEREAAIEYYFRLTDETAYSLEPMEKSDATQVEVEEEKFMGLREAVGIVLGCARVGMLDANDIAGDTKLMPIRDRELEAYGIVGAIITEYFRTH